MTVLPVGSWDAHVHLYDPERHPYNPDTPFSPPTRNVGHLIKCSPARNHIITMSVPDAGSPAGLTYALEIINEMGRDARGVVMLDPEQIREGTLRTLQAQGVRGIRIHVMTVAMRHGSQITDMERVLEQTAIKIHEADLAWPIEVQMSLTTWTALVPTLDKLHTKYGTIFVADHTFCADGSAANTPEFATCLDLVQRGIVHVKISGLARYAPPTLAGLDDMKGVTEAVLRCRHGDMALWGSDWPHVKGDGSLNTVDLGRELMWLKTLCNSIGEGYWEKITRDNAARLYL